SGFVIFLTIQRTQTLTDFAVSRFARLYPVFWASAGVTLLFQLWNPVDIGTTEPLFVLMNLTMLAGFVTKAFIDPAYWSLGFELMFYFIIAILFRARLLQPSRFVPVMATGLIGATLFAAVCSLVGWAFPIMPRQLTVPYTQLFIAGMVFFKLHQGERDWRLYALLAGCLAAHWTMLFNPGDHINLVSCLVVTASFGTFGLFLAGRLKFLAVKPLLTLGAWSYSLYLVHQVVGFSVMERLYTSGLVEHTVVAIAAALAVSLLLSWQLTIHIEQPAARAIKRWYRSRKAARSISGLNRQIQP
ncbi:MAG: acyltransferase, partial [Myxococcota bacterium]